MIEQLAFAPRLLIASDFDGTLAEIVEAAALCPDVHAMDGRWVLPNNRVDSAPAVRIARSAAVPGLTQMTWAAAAAQG